MPLYFKGIVAVLEELCVYTHLSYDGYLKFYDRYPIKEHFQNSEEGYWEISIFREQIEKIAERVLVAE